MPTCSQDYIERSRYLAEQLNALKTQMEDMKVDEKKTHNDMLHEEMVKQGGSKRRALQRVCVCVDQREGHYKCCISACEDYKGCVCED